MLGVVLLLLCLCLCVCVYECLEFMFSGVLPVSCVSAFLLVGCLVYVLACMVFCVSVYKFLSFWFWCMVSV